jgi:hypothetical protein
MLLQMLLGLLQMLLQMLLGLLEFLGWLLYVLTICSQTKKIQKY